MKDHLHRQIAKYETNPKTGEQGYAATDDVVAASISHIIGFEIISCVLTPAFKLSQDKSVTSIAGVVQGLKVKGAHDLAELVEEHSVR